VRRLADTIGFSQPVLYGHFPDGRDGIIRAVALTGFARLAELLTAAGDLGGICAAYLDFARSQPATYEAMFSMPTDLEFARPTTPEPLRAGFGPLLSTMGDETRAEVLWSALHGLADLSRHGRLRPDHETARVEMLIGLLGRGHLHK
jgi:Tetracyclin repressor-like, C-terminal domain